MTIIAVDNYTDRLSRFYKLLCEIFPDSEIVTFVDPLLAVKYSTNQRVDIAFIEMDMWPINGVQVTTLIRKFVESVSIYMVVKDKKKAEGIDNNSGISGYMQKPVTKDEINSLKDVVFDAVLMRCT